MSQEYEVIEVGYNRIEVETESEDVTISNGTGSVWLSSDDLAPLVLALLKLILEKGWHADANL